MIVTLRIFHNVFEHLDAYLFLLVTVTFLFFLLAWFFNILLLLLTTLKPHSTCVTQLVIESHLGHLVATLTSLAALAALRSLSLYLLNV
jgi:hypothetical protein